MYQQTSPGVWSYMNSGSHTADDTPDVNNRTPSNLGGWFITEAGIGDVVGWTMNIYNLQEQWQ